MLLHWGNDCDSAKAMRTPELSIVVPCLNEAENLPSLIKDLNGLCVENNLEVEVIILDDASQDNTLSSAASLRSEYPDLNIRVLHRYEPRRGYGAVVRYGMAHAIGRIAAIVAADGQNPIHLLPEMLTHARNGAQLVQCSRYSNRGDDEEIPFRFKLYQVIYRALVGILLGQHFPDGTYGFKVFDRVLVMALGLTSNRFSLSPEILFKVFLSGGKVVFVPGRQGVRRRGSSKFVLRQEVIGHARVLLRAWLHRFGILWF